MFRSVCLLEMMLTFFLLILMGLPCEDTAVNSTHGLDSNIHKLETTISPRENMICYKCAHKNTFTCPMEEVCEMDKRFCLIIATRTSFRELLVHKACIRDCPFLQSPAPMILRRVPRISGFYYTNCCTGNYCNDGGPSNIERDLIPFHVFEEDAIARAVCLEEFNLLLSLALILSSRILT